jgi:hypothetical protein
MSSQAWRTDPHRESVKQKIKHAFDQNVRGREPKVLTSKSQHDGWEGHWLQEQFGLTADAKNAPDLNGFELKDDTGTGVTTFGDWSADEYIFHSHAGCMKNAEKAASCKKCMNSQISRDEFLQIYGTPNPAKQNRHSWSGSVCPKVNKFNEYGQILTVHLDGTVTADYHYSKDNRVNKDEIVPMALRRDDVVLATWHSESLKMKLENKFKEHGWFKCMQESKGHGEYVGMVFGGPIEFEDWVEQVRLGNVYFDSGMYEGNTRNYSQWRASNAFWTSLIEETY